MDSESIRQLLIRVKNGELSVDGCLDSLKCLPFENIGFACIDHHRHLRRGASEVIFGEGKDISDIIGIMGKMLGQGENIMVTRLSPQKAEKVCAEYTDAVYHQRARVLTLTSKEIQRQGRGTILVISAGTSDLPVSEEAAVTARFMGNEVETVFDVGVSGLHRLFAHRERLPICQALSHVLLQGFPFQCPDLFQAVITDVWLGDKKIARKHGERLLTKGTLEFSHRHAWHDQPPFYCLKVPICPSPT